MNCFFWLRNIRICNYVKNDIKPTILDLLYDLLKFMRMPSEVALLVRGSPVIKFNTNQVNLSLLKKKQPPCTAFHVTNIFHHLQLQENNNNNNNHNEPARRSPTGRRQKNPGISIKV